MSERQSDAIFWIEVEKIRPNPYQPRREFDEDKLRTLADSIRQYGVLQPLVVTRQEVHREDGGLAVEYELIAGERRWRASKLAGIFQIPAVIRTGEDSDKMKLELAIIENLQREDLNPIERAQAFQKLYEEFKLTHGDIAQRVGKSRVYVTNTIRILALPAEMIEAVSRGQISEGHTRPLLMLTDRPEQQQTIFQEVVLKRLTVRETEQIARRIAFDRVRKQPVPPDIIEIEQKLSDQLGTRVHVEKRDNGGKVTIDFTNNETLQQILSLLDQTQTQIPVPAPEESTNDTLYDIKNFSL